MKSFLEPLTIDGDPAKLGRGRTIDSKLILDAVLLV